MSREVDERFEASPVPLDAEERWKTGVRTALRDGTRVFVAAGGDGTVHALVERARRIARHDSRSPTLPFGVVGLGSSNDFHKPVARRCSGFRCGSTRITRGRATSDASAGSTEPAAQRRASSS